MRSSGPLADRLALRELVESYNDAVFRNDAALWAEHWAPDAEWHIAGQMVVGRPAIVRFWSSLLGGFELAAIYATGGGLVVDGDRASGSWYMLEMLKPKDAPGLTYISRYDDDYVRETGEWRFARRAYTLLRET